MTARMTGRMTDYQQQVVRIPAAMSLLANDADTT
jgi:hypothetical protein